MFCKLPKGYSWKDLKDLAREVTSGEPGWADVESHPPGQTRTSETGCVRVTKYNEAVRIYRHFATRSSSLRVHLWDITANPPKFLTSNVAAVQQRSLYANHVLSYAANAAGRAASQLGQPWISYGAQPTTQNGLSTRQNQPASTQYMTAPAAQLQQGTSQYQVSGQYGAQVSYGRQGTDYAASAGQYGTRADALAQSFLNMGIAAPNAQQQQQDPSYVARLAAWQHAQRLQQAQNQAIQASAVDRQMGKQPLYATSPSGLPVNLGSGYARTESRGVFISGLPYTMNAAQIKKKFEAAGTIVSFDMPMDDRPSKSSKSDKHKNKHKGNARVQYRSAAEAADAVERFNDKVWDSRSIKVRFDTETTAVEPPPNPPSSANRGTRDDGTPVIVGGASQWARAEKARNDSAVYM